MGAIPGLCWFLARCAVIKSPDNMRYLCPVEGKNDVDWTTAKIEFWPLTLIEAELSVTVCSMQPSS